jgi:hypothetical protein
VCIASLFVLLLLLCVLLLSVCVIHSMMLCCYSV